MHDLNQTFSSEGGICPEKNQFPERRAVPFLLHLEKPGPAPTACAAEGRLREKLRHQRRDARMPGYAAEQKLNDAQDSADQGWPTGAAKNRKEGESRFDVRYDR